MLEPIIVFDLFKVEEKLGHNWRIKLGSFCCLIWSAKRLHFLSKDELMFLSEISDQNQIQKNAW